MKAIERFSKRYPCIGWILIVVGFLCAGMCVCDIKHQISSETDSGSYELGAYHYFAHQKYTDGKIPSMAWRRAAMNHNDGNMDSAEVWAIRDSTAAETKSRFNRVQMDFAKPVHWLAIQDSAGIEQMATGLLPGDTILAYCTGVNSVILEMGGRMSKSTESMPTPKGGDKITFNSGKNPIDISEKMKCEGNMVYGKATFDVDTIMRNQND